MIPVWLKIRIEEKPRRPFRLCLPLPIIYLILLPFFLLLFLIAAPVFALSGVNPFRVVGAMFALLGGARGFHVEVQQARSLFTISIV